MKPVSSDGSATDAPAAAAQLISPEQRARNDSVQLFLCHWRSALLALAVVTVAVIVTGREHVPQETWAIWGACVSANTVCQAAVCRAMERARTLGEAVRRWLPWLLTSVAINGVLWGLVPVLVSAGSTPVLVFACLFNAMLLFCIANAPGTPAMLLTATLPIGVLGALAVLRHGAVVYAGVGYAALIAMIAFYGLRLQAALRAGMMERYAAEALALDLRLHQQRLVALEHERTLLLERQRLTRDMHDGLGSALVASLAAVERGEVRPEQLAAMLRDCVDDLRTVIDSLEPIHHDLVALLASLRFRLERRLDAAGVRLEWQMEDLPTLPWLGSPEALHVIRIVQEVLNNVVKHGKARCVHLSARAVGGKVEVSIADDGIGFERAHAPPGRGLSSIQQRAAELGGTIEIESRPEEGTAVCLSLPTARRGDEGERPSREGNATPTQTVLKLDPGDVQGTGHLGKSVS
jgi:signal transduction histidine kinase